MVSDSSDSRSTAERLYADFLRRLEAGESLDFDAYCENHPDQAIALQHLRDKHAALNSDSDPGSSASSEFLDQLASHSPKASRYTLKGEIARGGMGVILKVWDEDLRRHLAMKLVLGKVLPSDEGSTSAVDPKTLGRFLEEAQVTGQLDHPGIVPVHELGVDDDGRVYFTMRLVKGRDLKAIFQMVKTGEEGWNRTRALGVLLKACEALAYAHSHGVNHRDLKPANVMVGRFGEVYVMDWGLAKVKGREDTKDLRMRLEESTSLKSVRTVRRDEAEGTPDSPLITMDGDVMGTPAFMSPEQAHGRVEEIGPRSDVYAMGAILYELLTGNMPYTRPGSRRSPRMILMAVQEGPPKPIHDLTSNVQTELQAICDKAMARSPANRYPDVTRLAGDLRAYLEGRIVGAHKPSPAFRVYNYWRTQHSAAKSGIVVAYGALITLVIMASTIGLDRSGLTALVVVMTLGILLVSTGILFKPRYWLASLLLMAPPVASVVDLATFVMPAEGAITIRLGRPDFPEHETIITMFEERERIALDADEPFVYWREAGTLYELGQPERALALLDLISDDAEYAHWLWRAGLMRAEILEHLGRDRDVLATLDKLGDDYRGDLLASIDNELQWRRHSMAVRIGAAYPEATELEEATVGKQASELNSQAWLRVDPDRSTFGREAEGLALARLAFAKAESSANIGDTLAWALHANGLDEEAVAASEAALRNASAEKKDEFTQHLTKLKSYIENSTPDNARTAIATLEETRASLETELLRRQ